VSGTSLGVLRMLRLGSRPISADGRPAAAITAILGARMPSPDTPGQPFAWLATAALLVLLLPTAGVAPARATTVEVDHALVLDGDGDTATAGTQVIPTTSGSAFTVEVWVYDADADAASWQEILSQGQGGTAFYLGTVFGSQEIRAGDRWLSTGVRLPVGRWVHLALVADAGPEGAQAARLYLDGVLEAQTSTFGGPTAAGTAFRLGTQYLGGEFWNGRIDTVRVWSVARTEAELRADMHRAVDPASTGLIAQYLANEGSGTTVANSATGPGAAPDLTLDGGTSWAPVATTATDGEALVVTFPRSAITAAGGWTVPAGYTRADLLVVAGGGGGGAWVGGGGGAGGMLEVSGATVAPGSVVPVIVGQGGPGAVQRPSGSGGFRAGSGGQDSAFGGVALATGGGVGASWDVQLPGSGGSGGGGSQAAGSAFVGAAGTAEQGSAGGDAFSDAQPHPTGGGGGAGGAGMPGQSATVAGAGGPGRTSSITGTGVVYAGGGGGGTHGTWAGATLTDPGTAGAGGSGGGGAGAAPVVSVGTVTGSDGTAGLGGGGGGAGSNCGTPCQTSIGGRGGSGVVIVRLVAVAVEPPAAGAGPAPDGPTVSCVPAPPRVGDVVTCTVTGGEPGIDILWAAAYDPVFASGPVALDARGEGTFSFRVPAEAVRRMLTVELVAWAAPHPVGVVGAPNPRTIPAGEGPRDPRTPIGPLVAIVALAVLLAAPAIRRTRSAR
jgi:hypothetical protein